MKTNTKKSTIIFLLLSISFLITSVSLANTKSTNINVIASERTQTRGVNRTGHNMESSVILYSNGLIKATTRRWSNNRWSGFTGGVEVIFKDSQNRELHTCYRHRGVARRKSNYSEWNDFVNPNLASQVKTIQIRHIHHRSGLKINKVDWEKVNQALQELQELNELNE